MTKSDPGFLEKLKKQALAEQEGFLDNIASRLGRKRMHTPPRRPVKGAPSFWNDNNPPLEDRIRLFMRHWEQAGGHHKRCSGMGDVKIFMQELIRETKAKLIIRQDQEELEPLDLEGQSDVETVIWNAEKAADADKDELMAKAAGADIGVVMADYAVAHTGSIVVTSSPRKGRTVSLLPTILIAIIRADQIKMRLGEVLCPMDQLPLPERPAGIHFISGPSRSADIENDLTIGVHGPGIVYAVILD